MENARKILAIDGGGIKGALPAAFLATIEQTTGKRFVDYFDLIVGTSTGGIIALGLGLGLSAREILAFYEDDGPRIFSEEEVSEHSIASRVKNLVRRRSKKARRVFLPKYRPDALKSALEKAFPKKTLGDSQKRLVIPAFDRQRRQVHVFKTRHHRRFELDWKESAVDVAMATAAAPTYFPGHRLENGISLLDGGIWANNPVGLAVVEAISILEWRPQDLYVLSLGCSEAPLAIPENSGMAGLALKMADVFLLGQSSGSLGTAKLLMGSQEQRKRLFRYQHYAAESEFDLDSAQEIPALRGIGASMARDALAELKDAFFSAPAEDFIPCGF